MADPPTETAGAVAEDLFDKYTLPKVALAVILSASLVGTWVTGRLHGDLSLGVTAAKWSYFVALGVLTGGLVWKHVFVRPADIGSGAGEYCAEMYERFDRIAVGALVVLAVAGAIVGSHYMTGPADAFVVPLGAATTLLILATAWTTVRTATADDQFRSPAGLLALALAFTVVGLGAAAEVALRGFEPVPAAIRTVHLLAFALWIGGAVWNIFVAVPTGKRRTTTAVVRAAGEQLERFRWAVRFIIPTLLLTGLYQAVDALGHSPGAYLGSVVGLAVVAKVGFIGLLFVIFKLCPMWRACSPIDGVCELDDLGTGPESSPTTEAQRDD